MENRSIFHYLYDFIFPKDDGEIGFYKEYIQRHPELSEDSKLQISICLGTLLQIIKEHDENTTSKK